MGDWEALRAQCENCQNCPLGQTRTNLVFGVGPENAEVMFIGEGPGQQEDLQGEPFVGPAGKLLDEMLCIIDLGPPQLLHCKYCEMPSTDEPGPAGVGAGCLHWIPAAANCPASAKDHRLSRQNLGDALIRPNFRITREHGQWFEKDGIQMTAIYHPSALLRTPEKRPGNLS